MQALNVLEIEQVAGAGAGAMPLSGLSAQLEQLVKQPSAASALAINKLILGAQALDAIKLESEATAASIANSI